MNRILSRPRTSLRWVMIFALLVSVCACNSKDPPVASGQPANEAAKAPADADAADWCKGHGVPESKCTKCNPELIPQFQKAGDWCADHGFPESVCPQCNPMKPPGDSSGAATPGADSAAAEAADWCKGHGVPESKCTKCNPELIPRFQKEGDWCADHGFPASVCPACKPSGQPAARTSAFEAGTRIRFKSREIEMAAGIAVAKVRPVEIGAGVACVGQVDYDQNRYADIRSTAAGIVRRALVSPGDPVRRGQVLFELESVQVGDAQGRVRTAGEQVETIRARHARVDRLRAEELLSAEEWETSHRELRTAETELRSARSALRIVGASTSGVDGRYALRSPIDGVVVRRDAVLGTLATEDTSLAAIADPTSVWVMLSVPETDASRLSIGAPAVIRSDGATEAESDGLLAWLSPQVDSRSRTVEARVEMKNPGGAFRAGQFVQAVVRTDPPQSAAAVPRDAVQRMGAESVVFVRVEPNVYEPRSVRTGRSDGGFVHVEGPIGDDDEVVTVGAFLLKTEISKENIGAGCCEIEEKS